MRVSDLLPAYERLGASDDPVAIFEAAAALAAGMLLADRAVVAAIVDGRVASPAGASPGGKDLLRALDGRTVVPDEARERPDDPPVLGELPDAWCLAEWVAPDGPPVALLVATRSTGAFPAADGAAARRLAGLVGIVVERAVLRRRAQAFAAEVARFGAEARGMAGEVLDPEPVLPARPAPAVPGPDAGGVLAQLTPQEKRVAILLSEGRANAAIADALMVSPETVKAHTARIRRKLGAANRVELIALLLEGTRR